MALHDASFVGGFAGAGPHTLTGVAVASNSNRALFITTLIGNVAEAFSAVTRNGQSATLIGTVADTSDVKLQHWVILNPTAGTFSVVGTHSGSPGENYISAVSMYDVDQVTPNGSPVSITQHNTGSTDVLSVNVTAASTSDVVLAFHGVSSNTGETLTPSAGQTARFSSGVQTYRTLGGSSKPGAAGSVTVGSKSSAPVGYYNVFSAFVVNNAAPDTTAPVLSSPTGTTTGTTTASGTVSTDEAAGTLYRLASTNATETASTIKAAALTTTVTATGTQSVTFTGLTASTTYYAHYVQDDAVPNTSNVVNSTSFTTSASGDTTAPTLSSPTGTATGSTTASGTVTTNEANGTLYSLVSTNSTETAATVKASGASQTITTTGVKTATATGLTASTVYYYHYVHRDAAGNDSTVSNSSSFTTSAPSTGSFTSRPMVNDTNTVFASQAGWTVRINNATTGDRIATKTSLTTSALGVLTYSDAGCTAGTNYEHIYIAPSGDKGMQDLVAA